MKLFSYRKLWKFFFEFVSTVTDGFFATFLNNTLAGSLNVSSVEVAQAKMDTDGTYKVHADEIITDMNPSHKSLTIFGN